MTKKPLVVCALVLAAGCAHQGGPGRTGSETGSAASSQTTSYTVEEIGSNASVETGAEPSTEGRYDRGYDSGPGTRGQSGVNATTDSRMRTGQETAFILNRDRGATSAATDRFRPDGGVRGIDDSRARINTGVPGQDGTPSEAEIQAAENADDTQENSSDDSAEPSQGVSPQSESGKAADLTAGSEAATSVEASAKSLDTNAQPAQSTPETTTNQPSEQQAQQQQQDDLAGVRALSVSPYRSGSSLSLLGGRSSLGVGSGPSGVSGSGSSFSSASGDLSASTVGQTDLGPITSDVVLPSVSALTPTTRPGYITDPDRTSDMIADDRERRLGLSDAPPTGAPVNIRRGLPMSELRNIDVVSEAGGLTLRGTVGSDTERSSIESRLRELTGIRSINNQLTVSPSNILPGVRTNDQLDSD